MYCKKCKLNKLKFQNYLNTNCFIFNFQIIGCLLDVKRLQSFWFQWSNIIEIVHDIIKQIMHNINYNKINILELNNFSFPFIVETSYDYVVDIQCMT